MSLQVKSALKDVSSELPDPPPPQLVSYCDRLYGQTLQKPLNKALEIGRYHVCAYLTVEKYMDKFDLPIPEYTRIPMPPKMAYKTINEFRNYLDDVKSASSTPKKRKLQESPASNSKYYSPQSSPTKYGSPLKLNKVSPVKSSPTKSSPLKKRLESLAEPETEGTDGSEIASDIQDSESNPFLADDPRPKPKTSTPLTIPRLIQTCNRFYIPPPITVHIIQSFLDQKHKFIKKNTWYLALGLIYAASLRINHRIASTKPDYNDMLLSQFIRQEHGLKRPNLSYWCGTINNAVQYDPWILEIEDIYKYGIKLEAKRQKELDAKLGPGYKIYDNLGAMVNSHSDLSSKSQEDYYNTWTSSVLQQLE